MEHERGELVQQRRESSGGDKETYLSALGLLLLGRLFLVLLVVLLPLLLVVTVLLRGLVLSLGRLGTGSGLVDLVLWPRKRLRKRQSKRQQTRKTYQLVSKLDSLVLCGSKQCEWGEKENRRRRRTHTGIGLELHRRVVLGSLARDLLAALGLDRVVLGNDLLDGSLWLLHGGGKGRGEG